MVRHWASFIISSAYNDLYIYKTENTSIQDVHFVVLAGCWVGNHHTLKHCVAIKHQFFAVPRLWEVLGRFCVNIGN